MAGLPRLPSTADEILAQYLLVDVERALTFLRGEPSQVEETQLRRGQIARNAYEAILRLSENVTPCSKEKRLLDTMMAELKAQLQASGQRF